MANNLPEMCQAINEKEYRIVNGNLLKMQEMDGSCGNCECQPNVLTKQNQFKEKEQCGCNQGTESHDSVLLFRRSNAVNPYRSSSDDSLNRKNKVQHCCKYTAQDDGCSDRNEVISFERGLDCKICTKYFANFENKTNNKNANRLCETVCEYNTQKQFTPTSTSESDEVTSNRNAGSLMSLDRYSRDYSCFLKNDCQECYMNPCDFQTAPLSDSDTNSNSRNDCHEYSMYSKKKGKKESNDYSGKFQSKSKNKRNSRSNKDQLYNSNGQARKGIESRPKTTNRLQCGCEVLPQSSKQGARKQKKKRISNNCNDMTHDEQIDWVQKNLKMKKKAKLKCKKLRIKSRYAYCFGNRHPKIEIGHQRCLDEHKLVPSRMGWLWNVPTLGIESPRNGWKPGAVTKSVKELMMHFLMSYPLDTLPVTKPTKKSIYTELKTPCMDPCSCPTLQVKKKNGEFVVCMNPLKDSGNLRSGENPYLECSPFIFKISKDAEAQKLDQCKQLLISKGFQPCTCENPCYCSCRTLQEKKLLEREMKQVSATVGLQTEMKMENFSADKDTESQDLNIEFSPPSALVGKKVHKGVKKDTETQETQYNPKDYIVPIPADKDLIKSGVKSLGKNGNGADKKSGAKKDADGKGTGGKGADGKGTGGKGAGGKGAGGKGLKKK